MKYLIHIFSFILVFACLSSTTSFASDYKAGKKIVIEEEVDRNLYIAAEEIRIEHKILGDLMAAGGSIIITEQLMDDAFMAGGEIRLDAKAEDDIRVIGGEIFINADVQGDLIITCGEVSIAPEVTIWGDLIIGGGEITCDGSVKGEVKIAGGEVDLNGLIEGNIDMKCGEANINAAINGTSRLMVYDLNLGDNARFLNDVQYWTEEGPINFENYLGPDAKAIFDENLKIEMPDVAVTLDQLRTTYAIYRFFSGMLLVLLIVLIFGNRINDNAGQLASNMKSYLGLGLALFIGLPIASFIALTTIVGAPIGFIGFSFFFIAMILANALASVLITYEIMYHQNANWSKGLVFLISLLVYGSMITIVNISPLVGGLLTSFITLVSCGYVIKKMVNRKQNNDQFIEVE